MCSSDLTTLDKGWSVDIWISNGTRLISPAALPQTTQRFLDSDSVVQTEFSIESLSITSDVFFKSFKDNQNLLFQNVSLKNNGEKPIKFSFYFAIRPYNPEGVSPIDHITYLTANAFIINNQLGLVLDSKPDNVVCLSEKEGDISEHFNDWEMILKAKCKHHQTSGFAEYKINLKPGETKKLSCKMPTKPIASLIDVFHSKLTNVKRKSLFKNIQHIQDYQFETEKKELKLNWDEHLKDLSSIQLPDEDLTNLFKKNMTYLMHFIGNHKIGRAHV